MIHRFRDARQGLAFFFVACILALVFGGIQGCTALGLQAPRTASPAAAVEDSLRYGQAIVTGIYKTVGDAAEVKSMTGPEARRYFNDAKAQREKLDSAEAVLVGIEPGGLQTADARVRAALQVLQGIAAELRKRLPPNATAALPAAK